MIPTTLTKDLHLAMRDAAATASEYADKGRKHLAELFGPDFETAHPHAAATFLAGFMTAASQDFQAYAHLRLVEALDERVQGVRDALSDLGYSIESRAG